MNIALAQISPVLLDRNATLDKVVQWIHRAADQHCGLVAFGEALVPGYPVWSERTHGATFNDDLQKQLHARYLRHAVCIEEGHLDVVTNVARERDIAVVLGIIERPADRGGHSLYCTCVYINPDGTIGSTHRKLMPTYEERLSWGIGDGHGLRTHRLRDFTVGALNCWENWMPLARHALYAQGENVHVAIWPGCEHNTRDITRFIARESRSYVLSAAATLRPADIPEDFPARDQIAPEPDEWILNGGSCIAGPDGEWVVPPQSHEETLVTADIDLDRVLQERQNFDPVGHYSRPDIFNVTVDTSRASFS